MLNAQSRRPGDRLKQQLEAREAQRIEEARIRYLKACKGHLANRSQRLRDLSEQANRQNESIKNAATEIRDLEAAIHSIPSQKAALTERIHQEQEKLRELAEKLTVISGPFADLQVQHNILLQRLTTAIQTRDDLNEKIELARIAIKNNVNALMNATDKRVWVQIFGRKVRNFELRYTRYINTIAQITLLDEKASLRENKNIPSASDIVETIGPYRDNTDLTQSPASITFQEFKRTVKETAAEFKSMARLLVAKAKVYPVMVGLMCGTILLFAISSYRSTKRDVQAFITPIESINKRFLGPPNN